MEPNSNSSFSGCFIWGKKAEIVEKSEKYENILHNKCFSCTFNHLVTLQIYPLSALKAPLKFGTTGREDILEPSHHFLCFILRFSLSRFLSVSVVKLSEMD